MKIKNLVFTLIILNISLVYCIGQESSHLSIDWLNKSNNNLNLGYSLQGMDTTSAYLVRIHFAYESTNQYREITGLTGDFGVINFKNNYSVSIPQTIFKSNDKIKIKLLLERIPNRLKSFTWIPVGSFHMGDDNGEEDAKPAHPVKIDSYFISRFETTVKEYKEYCMATGKEFPDQPIDWKDSHPMTFISWYDAKEYTLWLQNNSGIPFRLPSESEWEFAAGGAINQKQYAYSGSDNINDVGWYRNNSVGTMHSEVGILKSNKLGIFDMSGNVWEWCEDWYSSKYYSISPSENPDGPRVGKVKVARGGSWYHPQVSTSYRFFMTPTAKTNYVGVRVACSDKVEFHSFIDEVISDPVTIQNASTAVAQISGQPLKLEVIQPATVNPFDTVFVIDNKILIKGSIDDPQNTLLILVNGVETKVDDNGNFETFVKLKYLINQIPIKAISKANITTEKSILVYRAANAQQISSRTNKMKRNDYALLIATNEYEDFNNLINPVFDINTLDQELRENFGFKTKVVLNPTLDRFYTGLRELSKRKYSDQDQLLIFIAGHGEYDNLFGDGYLVMADSRKSDQNKTSFVSHSNLRSIINNIDCDHILVIMDACFSGTFDPLIARRGGEDIYNEVNKDEFINRKLKYKTRLYITSGGKEYVPDGRPNAHSPFARNFISALRNYGGEDNVLTFNEIISYIEKTKPEPHYGEFGENEPGSDFLFITKFK